MGASKLVIAFLLHLFSSGVLSIWIENNAYRGIHVSSSSGDWSDQNFERLKEVLKKSSEYLYHATRNRSYFGEFVISRPSPFCPTSLSAPSRVDVYVTPDSNPKLRTQHSRGCGERGEIMYMPLDWLMRGDVTELAREFVQQWSIYRYGVFEEDPIESGSCYRSKDSWNPVGCYDRKKISETSPVFKNGLPLCSIDFNDTSGLEQSKSSLMFTSNMSKALDFCDGSPTLPHDPAMPTLHNSLCGGETTWSVIQNSQDFKFGKNKPLMQPPPATKFTFFCQTNMQLTFAIQNGTSNQDLTEAVAEIGYSLYQYLLSRKDLTEVKVVMFSDKEDESGPLKLDTASKNLKNEIVEHVKAFRVVSNDCVSCGLRKAFDASSAPSTVVVVAWENAIGDSSELLKELVKEQQKGHRVHLLLLENTEADVLSAELLSAVRSTGGHVFHLPKRLVAMASALHAVLATALGNPLQVEDDDAVVHEAVLENIDGSFTDSFTTLNPENGTLEYLIHCHPLNRIVPTLPNCVRTSSSIIDTYKCVEELEPNQIKLWEFHHKDKGGTKPANCSSVAILRNRLSTSKEKLTLKGWLSNYAIEPGKDPLIVYAEIIGPSADYQVKAEISGPDNFSLELRDNGNGDPDVKGGDGIFSRYFMPLSLKKGSYGIKILAESKIPSLADTDDPTKIVKIRRQSKSIGFFSVTKSFPEEDIFPPSRVGDLRAVAHHNGSVTLQWTAPGNDYDSGTATSYEIKYSTIPSSLSDPYFNSEENTEPPHKSELTPGKSGTTEKTEIIVLSTHDQQTCYFALRAKDANDNRGKVSNIIQIHIEAMEPTSSTSRASTESTKIDTTVPSTTVPSELPTTLETSTVPVGNEFENFFDKKFLIIASAAAGVLLLIILINVIVCCCCCEKRKDKTSVRKSNNLQSPYSLNIAYQDDSPDENERDISVVTVENPSVYSEPRNKRSSPRYTYHTSGSINNRGKSQNNRDQLGFQLVNMPSTRSLSRLKNRLNDSNSETDSEGKPIPAPQQAPIKDAHIYSLGIV